MAGKLVLAVAMSHVLLPWDSSTSISPGTTIASMEAVATIYEILVG